MIKKSQNFKPDYYLLMDILWKLSAFEHNNDCFITLHHDGNVHSNIFYLECSFKNNRQYEEQIRRYINTYPHREANMDLRYVIDSELIELEKIINGRRGIKKIKLSEIIAMANKCDCYGYCLIVKHDNGSISVRVHDTPTYYGDNEEPDPDDFWSLYCTIDYGVITDTWRMNDNYKGYQVDFDKEYEYCEEE